MDTINVKMKLEKSLTKEEFQKVLSGKIKDWIFKFKELNSPMERDKNTYTFSLSFPRFFDRETNAYLIKKQWEVDLVIQRFTEYIEIELGNKIVSAIVTRIDYPFTFYMEDERNYNSYRSLFDILGRASKIVTIKNIEEMRENKKETHIFCSSSDSTKRVDKIITYNQLKKIKDKYSKLYKIILERYPDLDRRMRIEVSIKAEKSLYKLKLKKIKTKAYEYIIENLFNENLIDDFLRKEVLRLTESLQKERINNKKVYASGFIHKEKPVSYECLRKAINTVYLSPSSKEHFITKSRISLREMESKEQVIYFSMKNEIKKLKNSLKKEKMRSTK